MDFFSFVFLLVLTVISGIFAWGRFQPLLNIRKDKVRRLAVSGVIESAGVFEVEVASRFRWIEYRPGIRFSYFVGGSRYSGGQVFLAGELQSNNKAVVEDFVQNCFPGKEVDVYVCPDDPRDAVLFLREAPGFLNRQIATGGGFFVVVIVCCLLLVFLLVG